MVSLLENAPLEIIECEQNTDEWIRARMGVVTTSMLKAVLAGSKHGPRGGEPKEAKTRRKYMLQLIGEHLTGEPKYEWEGNDHTERGKKMESEARDWYQFTTGNVAKQIGFLKRIDIGASPDSLIGEDGLLEIKTKLPHLQLEVLLDGVLPPDHRDQVQGQLWVSERKWCDFVSYWPGLPGFRIRVPRDDQYIQTEIEPGVRQFLDEMNETMLRIRSL